MNTETLRAALRNLIQAMFPELRDGTHLTHRARVTAVHGDAGSVQGEGPRHYSVDVQPLTPGGADDPTRAPIHDVPLGVAWTGPDSRGIYHLPAVGSQVLVGYIGGNPSYPYLDRALPDGRSVPAVQDGELLIQHSPAVTVRIKPDGTLEVDSTEPVIVNSTAKITVHGAPEVLITSDSVINVDAPVVNEAGGGPGSARIGDDVQVTIAYGSSAGTHPGKIITGSGRVFVG